MATIINTSKKSTITADMFVPKMTLTLTFVNGKEVVIDANSLSDEIRNMAILHGLKQKLVDAAAISRNLETGASATVDEKYEAVKKIADRLTSPDGKWNEGRAAADGATSSTVQNILVRAVMRMTGHDEQYTRDWLGAKTKEQRAALRKNPRVVAIMAELQAATVVNGVNTDDLLSELGVDAPQEVSRETSLEQPALPKARSSKKKLVSASE